MVLPLKRRKSRSPPGSPNPQPTPSPRRRPNHAPDLIRGTLSGGPQHAIAAGWSSPVARQAHNLKVVGSNPTPATIPILPGSTGGPNHSAGPLPSSTPRNRAITSPARCSPAQAYFKRLGRVRTGTFTRRLIWESPPCGMWFPPPRCSRIAKRHAPMALSLLPAMQTVRGRSALTFSWPLQRRPL
jgi:hypothetical protein